MERQPPHKVYHLYRTQALEMHRPSAWERRVSALADNSGLAGHGGTARPGAPDPRLRPVVKRPKQIQGCGPEAVLQPKFAQHRNPAEPGAGCSLVGAEPWRSERWNAKTIFWRNRT